MELSDFVKISLVQILDGVKTAQEIIKEKYDPGLNIINPDIMYSADNAPKGKYFATQERNLVHLVEFDVAVTTDRSSEAKGNAGLQVAGIGFGADLQQVNQNSTISRIKFQVPITLPKLK